MAKRPDDKKSKGKKSKGKKSKGKKKIIILDTNVLLHDPNSIFAFKDNDVIIPIVVVEELDNRKKGIDEVSRNARQISRILDGFRKEGRLAEGIKLENGGTIRVELNHQSPKRLPEELVSEKADNRILAMALNFKEECPEQQVILVTKDTNLRIKADVLNVIAEDYETGAIAIDELYSGESELIVAPGVIDDFYAKKGMSPPGKAPYPNEFILLKNSTNPHQTALTRYDAARKTLVPLQNSKYSPWGITHKNKEQQYALDLLMNEEIMLVTLIGKAGTGKTLLALATGLDQVLEKESYKRLVVARPVFEMGKGTGFLPGLLEEKLRPYMQPIRDNLDFLMGASSKKNNENSFQSLIDQEMIQIEALSFIRGRSMPDLFFIIDEAQNLTPHEVKTIITRAGKGTKIILTGDPYQIDNPYVDSSSNGLTYAADRFKDQPMAGHIMLTKGERSPLAELAATIL